MADNSCGHGYHAALLACAQSLPTETLFMYLIFQSKTTKKMSIRNIQTIDLASSREASDMTDVKFIFKDSGSKGNIEIKANKTILAYGSDVFKIQFFGSIPESDSVPIEDSSIDTFNMFVDILYNKKVELNELSLKVLGDLFYLGEKYHVEDLKDAIAKNVSSRKIEADGIIVRLGQG